MCLGLESVFREFSNLTFFPKEPHVHIRSLSPSHVEWCMYVCVHIDDSYIYVVHGRAQLIFTASVHSLSGLKDTTEPPLAL